MHARQQEPLSFGLVVPCTASMVMCSLDGIFVSSDSTDSAVLISHKSPLPSRGHKHR